MTANSKYENKYFKKKFLAVLDRPINDVIHFHLSGWKSH